MLSQRLLSNYRHRFVRREVMFIVLENEQIQRGNEPVRRVPRSHVDLMILQRPSEQTQIHDARLFVEA